MPLRPVTRDRLQALAVFELAVFAMALVVQFMPRRGVLEWYHLPPGLGTWIAAALLLSVALNVVLAVITGAILAYMRATGRWVDAGGE